MKKLYLITAVLLLTVSISYAQMTVLLTNGDSFKAEFVGADSTQVKVDKNGNMESINISDISALFFNGISTSFGDHFNQKSKDYFLKIKDIENQKFTSHWENLALSTLRTLATACEIYATANKGEYPLDFNDLTQADPPYLIKRYCDSTIEGYYYQCEFSAEGYKHTAVPEEKDKTEYIITTGGILTP